MKKTRIILSLTAVVLSLAGGVATTFANTFASKGVIVATIWSHTIVNMVETCTRTVNAACATLGGAVCTGYFSDSVCETEAKFID